MLLATKLKNSIKKIKSEGLEFYLKNIQVNGAKKGCSGFVKNIQTNKIVYINTEKSCYGTLNDLNLYRTAKSLNDFTGGRNCWARDDKIAQAVVELLE